MKILVGLSGGVDSAVAAYFLKEAGHDVTCAFMRNWDSLTNDDINGNPTLNEPICSQEKDWLDAKSVADMLGLELLRVDFIQEYWDQVFHRFIEDYKKGRTPNPDILCNQYIKFDRFYHFAMQHGFEYVATGHYVKLSSHDGYNVLAKADDFNKDQSYFLCKIQRDTLNHVLFPLGDIDKPKVREIAQKLNLVVAKKKDSTGICFIGERNFRQFLSNYLPMKPGKIINISNKKVVGEHQGVLYYTIGQRKGLNIGGTGPYYVIGKDVVKNELYVTDEMHQEWLYSDYCLVGDLNWLADFDMPISCTAKFRYRQVDQEVSIQMNDDNTLLVKFVKKQRSVTPGQEAVFYLNDIMLGGGTIETVYQGDVDLMEKIREEIQK